MSFCRKFFKNIYSRLVHTTYYSTGSDTLKIVLVEKYYDLLDFSPICTLTRMPGTLLKVLGIISYPAVVNHRFIFCSFFWGGGGSVGGKEIFFMG